MFILKFVQQPLFSKVIICSCKLFKSSLHAKTI